MAMKRYSAEQAIGLLDGDEGTEFVDGGQGERHLLGESDAMEAGAAGGSGGSRGRRGQAGAGGGVWEGGMGVV